MIRSKKLLVVQLAAFGADVAARMKRAHGGLSYRSIASVFPAVTCTAQATFRTGAPPSMHGMVANGVHHARLK